MSVVAHGHDVSAARSGNGRDAVALGIVVVKQGHILGSVGLEVRHEGSSAGNFLDLLGGERSRLAQTSTAKAESLELETAILAGKGEAYGVGHIEQELTLSKVFRCKDYLTRSAVCTEGDSAKVGIRIGRCPAFYLYLKRNIRIGGHRSQRKEERQQE